jgi:hypothetical protein
LRHYPCFQDRHVVLNQKNYEKHGIRPGLPSLLACGKDDIIGQEEDIPETAVAGDDTAGSNIKQTTTKTMWRIPCSTAL